MIRRACGPPRLHVDVALCATCGELFRRENMIDAPAPVILKRPSEVIPVSVLNAVWMHFTEKIDKAPRRCFFEGIPRIDVKIDVVDPMIGMVDVDRFGSNVDIAEPDRRTT